MVHQVEGGAHGSDWYANVLDLRGDDAFDRSFPITILVEEGKHASAPDRNGDGHYTPGYDVNRRVNDAWGVRDILRSGEMAASRYDASHTKPRDINDRIGPSVSGLDDSTACVFAAYRRGRASTPMRTYSLVQASSDFIFIPNKIGCGTTFDLCKAVRERGLVSPPRAEAINADGWFLRTLLGTNAPGGSRNRVLRVFTRASLGYRQDGEERGISIVPPFLTFEIPRFGGWLLPKMNLVSGRGVTWDAMYSPSVARWADWYVAIGGLADDSPDSQLQSELGVKFRFLKGGGFKGVRVGYRWSGFSVVGDQRMVFEANVGAW
jgi:hypothetical protein